MWSHKFDNCKTHLWKRQLNFFFLLSFPRPLRSPWKLSLLCPSEKHQRRSERGVRNSASSSSSSHKDEGGRERGERQQQRWWLYDLLLLQGHHRVERRRKKEKPRRRRRWRRWRRRRRRRRLVGSGLPPNRLCKRWRKERERERENNLFSCQTLHLSTSPYATVDHSKNGLRRLLGWLACWLDPSSLRRLGKRREGGKFLERRKILSFLWGFFSPPLHTHCSTVHTTQATPKKGKLCGFFPRGVCLKV